MDRQWVFGDIKQGEMKLNFITKEGNREQGTGNRKISYVINSVSLLKEFIRALKMRKL
jgi:hypothetical protein